MCALVGPVASLGLVSPGAATDGVTLLKKLTTVFSHRPLESDDVFSCRLPTTPIFPCRLYSILSKFSHKKLIIFGCNPLDGATALAYPLPPSATSKHFAYCIGAEVTEGATVFRNYPTMMLITVMMRPIGSVLQRVVRLDIQ